MYISGDISAYSGPIYKLVTTELGGERRFAASVARRLQSLGALTKGDRRAATGADLSHFNYDTAYGRTALKLMYQAICKVGPSQLRPFLSQRTLTMFVRVVALCYQHHTMECHNSHKHSQSPSTIPSYILLYVSYYV